MSFAFAKDTVRKGLDAHSAIGLVCCALLYLICATGTAIVLYEEWQRLEQHDAPEMTAIAPASVNGVTTIACPRRARRKQPSIIG